jgi:hypothetical protein
MTFKISDNPKSAEIKFRVAPADKAMIHERAAQENLSVGVLLTRLAGSRAISSKTDMHNVNEIRFLIEALRDIYSAGQPVNDERLRPVLRAAVDALNRIAGRPHQLK